jgi:PDZ domain-containing protein
MCSRSLAFFVGMSTNSFWTTRSFPKIKFGLTWLIVIPGSIWALVTYYLPVFGGTLLTPAQTQAVTPILLILVAASVVCHVGAHLWVARLTGLELPSEITVFIFGDGAQSWSTLASPWHESLTTAAGPLANLLLGGAAYLIWDLQFNNFVGVITLLTCGFNVWLFIINLIPAFPMDGGRLLRVCLADSASSTEQIGRLLQILGFTAAAALSGWAVFLFLQHARFSTQTASITILFVILLLDGLRLQSSLGTSVATSSSDRPRGHVLRIVGALLLALMLTAASCMLLLTNNGLDAPGVALPIQSMVNLPDQYRHPYSGSFYLVTVISEAPITAGEWILGQVDPAIQIVPPEVVVPKNTTPQEQARQGYQQLDESEATATAVGLQLAGYPDSMVGKGAQVVSILPDSHASGVLQVGDVITSLNGKPVGTTADLIEMAGAQSLNATVNLTVQRGPDELQVSVPLMAPAAPGDTPKIGIVIQSAGFDFKPPFPISIVTQKINGGPSAGLMFTLTVYNLLTPGDLSGGHKIAGTGTINLDGTVGPIGGVKQKVFAAEAVGAKYFLCPVENYADAASVAKDNIQVVKVATVQQALDFLQALQKH